MKDHLIVILCALSIVALCAALVAGSFYNEHTRVIEVVKAERVHSGKSSKYLVYTKKSGVFRVDDAWLRGSFDASDRYGRIAPGGTYTCVVVGYRLEVFSCYPNLLEVSPARDLR